MAIVIVLVVTITTIMILILNIENTELWLAARHHQLLDVDHRRVEDEIRKRTGLVFKVLSTLVLPLDAA